MKIDSNRLNEVLADLKMGSAELVGELVGGSSPVFKIVLSTGDSIVLKVYSDDSHTAPSKDAFAASRLSDTDIPVTRYFLVDETKTKLPFRFAITNYLPGVAADTLGDHQDIASLYRQTGQLLRSLHAIEMPAYGALNATGIVNPVPSNTVFVRMIIDQIFKSLPALGADVSLTSDLRSIVEQQFERITLHSNGPVFAHDDLHPNNILALEDANKNLALSGLIDFGNARAADAVFDLAKCLFCSEHDAPGSTSHILAGYGKIDHPDPEGAIWYYTLLHRMSMWCWLRNVGVIPTADSPSDLMDDLLEIADQPTG